MPTRFKSSVLYLAITARLSASLYVENNSSVYTVITTSLLKDFCNNSTMDSLSMNVSSQVAETSVNIVRYPYLYSVPQFYFGFQQYRSLKRQLHLIFAILLRLLSKQF